jgi:aminopeptidase N
MHAHAYGSTVGSDLWAPMQQVAGMPIVQIERDFTRQEGVPLVSVSRAPRGVSLSQSRFVDDPSTLVGDAPQTWQLPLAVEPVGGAKHEILLRGTSDLIDSPPVLVNAGQLGYARVRYTADVYDSLKPGVPTLAAADQLGLLNDSWALALAEDAPITRVMDLAVLLPPAANPVVWEQMLEVFEQLDTRYSDGPQRAAYRRFVLGVLAPVSAGIGVRGRANESSNVEIMRGHLHELQGRLGDAAVIASAQQQAESRAGTAAEQRAVLNIVATQADAKAFDTLLARARRTSDPLAKAHLFQALAGTSEPALAHRMMNIALSNEVPAGTNEGLIERLAVLHPDIVWEALAPRLGDPQLPLSKLQRWYLAGAVAACSSKLQRITDLEEYVSRNVPTDARKPFLESVAAIHRNRRIEDRLLPEVDRWVASRN